MTFIESIGTTCLGDNDLLTEEGDHAKYCNNHCSFVIYWPNAGANPSKKIKYGTCTRNASTHNAHNVTNFISTHCIHKKIEHI